MKQQRPSTHSRYNGHESTPGGNTYPNVRVQQCPQNPTPPQQPEKTSIMHQGLMPMNPALGGQHYGSNPHQQRAVTNPNTFYQAGTAQHMRTGRTQPISAHPSVYISQFIPDPMSGAGYVQQSSPMYHPPHNLLPSLFMYQNHANVPQNSAPQPQETGSGRTGNTNMQIPLQTNRMSLNWQNQSPQIMLPQHQASNFPTAPHYQTYMTQRLPAHLTPASPQIMQTPTNQQQTVMVPTNLGGPGGTSLLSQTSANTFNKNPCPRKKAIPIIDPSTMQQIDINKETPSIQPTSAAVETVSPVLNTMDSEIPVNCSQEQSISKHIPSETPIVRPTEPPVVSALKSSETIQMHPRPTKNLETKRPSSPNRIHVYANAKELERIVNETPVEPCQPLVDSAISMTKEETLNIPLPPSQDERILKGPEEPAMVLKEVKPVVDPVLPSYPEPVQDQEVSYIKEDISASPVQEAKTKFTSDQWESNNVKQSTVVEQATISSSNSSLPAQRGQEEVTKSMPPPVQEPPKGKALQKSKQKKKIKDAKYVDGSDMDAFVDKPPAAPVHEPSPPPPAPVEKSEVEGRGEVTLTVNSISETKTESVVVKAVEVEVAVSASPVREPSPVSQPPEEEVVTVKAEEELPQVESTVPDGVTQQEPSSPEETEETKLNELETKEEINNINEDECVENGQPNERITTVSLKYVYTDYQWSPINPQGLKKYGREFLLQLSKDPQSLKMPENISSEVDIVLKDKEFPANTNTNRRANSNFNAYNTSSNISRGNGFVPEFIRSPSSQRGVSKRNSQQGRSGNMSRGSNSRGYNSQSLRDDYKMVHSENAWRPQKFNKTSDQRSKEEQEIEQLQRKIRGLLNKLTPQKYMILLEQFLHLNTNTGERRSGFIKLVFEKAIDEPAFANCYAMLCRDLTRFEKGKSGQKGGNDDMLQSNFRINLVTRCQTEFEANKMAELDSERKLEEIKSCKDPEKRKELQLIYDEQERRIRMKSVGLVRFIGELYKFKMLTLKIMFGCIKQLLDRVEEESLECLCKLLTTIGKELEQSVIENYKKAKNEKSDKSDKESHIANYEAWFDFFNKMKQLSRKDGEYHISSRVRFMLQDVIELRENKWVPRRDENKPKTIAEIKEDIEREALNAQLIASAPRKHMDERREPGRRNNQRSGGPSGGSMSNDSEGWKTVAGKSYKGSSYQLESNKLQAIKKSAALDSSSNLGRMELGPQSSYSSWRVGSSMKHERNFTDRNAFDVLNSASEDRKPALMGMRNLKPSPSIEKERAIQGLKEVNLLEPSLSGQTSPQKARGDTIAPNSEVESVSEKMIQAEEPTPVGVIPPEESKEKLADPSTIKVEMENTIKEYCYTSNFEDVALYIADFIKKVGESPFLALYLEYILEAKSDTRLKASQLVGDLMKKDLLKRQIVLDELYNLVSVSEDILFIDLPLVWEYLGEIIGSILLTGVISFEEVKDMMTSPKAHNMKTLRQIFEILSKEVGPQYIKEKWDESKVSIEQFVPSSEADLIKKFYQDYSFLLGSPIQPGNTGIPIAKVEEKLKNFLKDYDEKKFDTIYDWSTANLGDQTHDPLFIEALTNAIIKTSINIKSKKVDGTLLRKKLILLIKYIDRKEELELKCLYTIQDLVVNSMESPPGMLLSIFTELYDSEVISHEGFLKWRKRDHEEGDDIQELPGKGVAIATLQSFFKALMMDQSDPS